MTIADLYNVVHFKIDEDSKAQIQQTIDTFCTASYNMIEFAMGIAEGAAEEIQNKIDAITNGAANGEDDVQVGAEVSDDAESNVRDDIDDIVDTASENSEVPVKPEVDEASKNTAIAEVTALKSTLTKILGAIGITFGLAQLKELTEEFNGINDEINYATEGLSNLKEIQQDILQAANDCKANYGDLADYAVTLSQQNKDLFPIEDATGFAKLVNQVEQSAGKGDNVANVQTMMSTIFATGELSSAALTKLEKRAPEVVNVIANGLGVTKTQLESMAEAGTITADKIKQAYINSGADIQESFDGLDYSISDGLTAIRNKWGYKLDEVNVKFGLTEKVARAIVRVSDALANGFDIAVNVIEKLADAVGGMDNLFKLAAAAVGSFMLAWKGEKIIKGIQSITSLLNPANLKIMAIAAAIVLVFLLVQDFITFLQGGDSVFGSLLEGAGADVDQVRSTIIDALTTVQQVVGQVVGAISAWVTEHSDDIQQVVQAAWGIVQGIFTAAYGIFTGLATFISGILNGDISEAISGLGTIWQGVCDGIDKAARALFGDGLVDAIEGFVDTAGAILQSFFGWIGAAIDGIGNFFGGIGTAVSNFFNGGSGTAGNTVDNAVNANTNQTNNNNNTINQTNNNTFNVTDRSASVVASGAVAANSNKAADQLANQMAHTGR